jgi:transcriptional antiterminator NusG
MQWYVVHTLTGHEHKVKKILQKLIKEKQMEQSFGKVVIPVENQVRIRKGKKVV